MYAGAVSKRTVQGYPRRLEEIIDSSIISDATSARLKTCIYIRGQGSSLVGVIDKRVATDPLVRPPRRRDNSENA